LWDDLFQKWRNKFILFNIIPRLLWYISHSMMGLYTSWQSDPWFNLDGQTWLSCWTCTSVLKHFIQKCSIKGSNTWKWNICSFSREQVYWCWIRHVAISNCFGLILWQPLYQHFSALVLLILGHGLLLHLLQHYAPSLWLAHTESKFPVKLVLGLTENVVTKYALLQIPHKQVH